MCIKEKPLREDSHAVSRRLSRRGFLTAAAAMPVAIQVAHKSPEDSRSQIQYIRQIPPDVSVPEYQGTSYDDRVPDTFDLAERANLAINALTGIADPAADYEVCFVQQINRRPIVMSHEQSDGAAQPKFMEALTLLRTVTGSSFGKEAEIGMVKTAARMLGDDGLYYQPIHGRPWTLRLSHGEPMQTWDGKRADRDPIIMKAGQVTEPYSCGRLLLAMTLWYERDKNPFWRQISEKMVDKFREHSVDRGDCAYLTRPFGTGLMTPGEKPDPRNPPVTSPVAYLGAIHGMSRFYQVTGYEPALRLAGKFSRFMRDHAGWFDSEGRAPNRHFHGGTCTLLAMLEYAALAGDREMQEFVRKSYEWHRTVGSALVGFFPEVVRNDYPTTESCEIANMIDLAVRLSQLGLGDYWDDADRYLRNQFAENQLTNSGEWMQRIANQWPEQPVMPCDVAEDVVARNRGAFAGWARGNDFIRVPTSSMNGGFVFMHCCTGNAARAIYYAWKGILDFEADTLRVNLLLNRASPWADVYSFLPYQGKVDVVVKRPCRLWIRIPGWVEATRVAVQVGEEQRPVLWKGRYVEVGRCATGDRASVVFPICERSVQETIGGKQYTLRLKGHEVVDIDPPGKYSPLYQRDHYQRGQVLWKKVRRFVSEETLVT